MKCKDDFRGKIKLDDDKAINRDHVKFLTHDDIRALTAVSCDKRNIKMIDMNPRDQGRLWSQSHVDFLSCDRRHLQKRLVITLNVCVNILKTAVQKLIGGCWFQDVLVWNSSGINTHFTCLSSYLRVKQHSESERNDCAKADTKAVPTIVSTLLVVRKYCCDVRQKITRYVWWLKSLDRSLKVPVGCVLFVMWTVGRHFISQ